MNLKRYNEICSALVYTFILLGILLLSALYISNQLNKPKEIGRVDSINLNAEDKNLKSQNH